MSIWRDPLLWVVAVALMLYLAWPRPQLVQPPEELEKEVVLSLPLPPGTVAATGQWYFGSYQIKALQKIEFEGLVLRTQPYYHGRAAGLSPLDLAVGWGKMADPQVLENSRFWQRDRFLYWRVDEGAHLKTEEANRQLANMHLIPKGWAVKDRLMQLRAGQTVILKGYLVEVSAPDGWHWKSSLTREDTGDGACEVIYVEQIYGKK